MPKGSRNSHWLAVAVAFVACSGPAAGQDRDDTSMWLAWHEISGRSTSVRCDTSDAPSCLAAGSDAADRRELRRLQSIQAFWEMLDADGQQMIAGLPQAVLDPKIYMMVNRSSGETVDLADRTSTERSARTEARRTQMLVVQLCGPEALDFEPPPILPIAIND